MRKLTTQAFISLLFILVMDWEPYMPSVAKASSGKVPYTLQSILYILNTIRHLMEYCSPIWIQLSHWVESQLGRVD